MINIFIFKTFTRNFSPANLHNNKTKSVKMSVYFTVM